MKPLLVLLTSAIFPSFAQEHLLDAEQRIQNGAPLNSAASFRGHPLYPYLQYRAYRDHLTTTPPGTIATFLRNNPGAPYAGWLAEHTFPLWLANGQEQTIIDSYDPRFSDESIECEYRLANLNLGNQYHAFNGIEQLWLKAGNIESACDPLFNAAINQHKLSSADLRKRFYINMQANNDSIARHISRMMPAADAAAANLWLDLANGTLPYQQAALISAPHWRHSALANALSRQAFKDTNQVATIALSQHNPQSSDPDISADLYNRLTRALARNDDPRLIQTWARIPAGKHDDNTTYDLIAYFLRQHDWQTLAQTLAHSLAPDESKPEVHYWLGKAYEKLGQRRQSQQQYRLAAQQRDFFGFLAAEKLGLDYAFNDHPISTDPTIQQTLLSEPESYRLAIFHNLGLDNRALPEWRSLIKDRDPATIRQAALLADKMGWHFQAIVALADIKDWDALSIRFPTDYEARIRALAAQHNLSPATIYAIIRKESIFQPHIKSHAGAIGLMQLMPATARDTARRYNIPYQGSSQLTDPTTNLTIGSQYLADRLNEFGHLAYAAAAYNAGPQRARQWLADYPDRPLDEWIAQIPFNETRDYVKSVLEYQKVYQYRLGLPYTPYSSATVRAW